MNKSTKFSGKNLFILTIQPLFYKNVVVFLVTVACSEILELNCFNIKYTHTQFKEVRLTFDWLCEPQDRCAITTARFDTFSSWIYKLVLNKAIRLLYFWKLKFVCKSAAFARLPISAPSTLLEYYMKGLL